MAGFSNAERLVLYTHLRGFESDFDKSQSQVRAISAAWSGVVLGAVALIATNAFSPPNGMSDANIAIRADTLAVLRTLVCMIGSAGVYAFWFIDQRIYQRLLHSVFAYGLFVEMKNRDLPQIRSSMFIANLDVTNGLGWFYRTQFIIFLLISVLLGAAVDGKIIPAVLLLGSLHAGGAIIGNHFSESWRSLHDLARDVYGSGPEDLAQKMPVGRTSANYEELKRDWLERIRADPVPPKPDPSGMAIEQAAGCCTKPPEAAT